MKSEIIFKPMVRVSFNPEEVEVLKQASQQHYDYTCKNLSNPGGDIYGMVQELAVLERGEVDRVMDFRKVDLLAKVTEYFGTTGIHGNQVLRDLHWKLAEVLRELNKAVSSGREELGNFGAMEVGRLEPKDIPVRHVNRPLDPKLVIVFVVFCGIWIGLLSWVLWWLLR